MIEYTSGPRLGRKFFVRSTLDVFTVTEEKGHQTTWVTVWPLKWKFPRVFLVGNQILDKCEFRCIIDASSQLRESYKSYMNKHTSLDETKERVYSACYVAVGKLVKHEDFNWIGEVKIIDGDMAKVKVNNCPDQWYAKNYLRVVCPENFLVGKVQCGECLHRGTASELKAKIIHDTIVCVNCQS